jgi:phage terminase large subunit-like protein
MSELDEDYPYYFSHEAANKIIKFAHMMPHTKGKWSGTLIVLEPWQLFILSTLFGWLKRSDDLRRFTEFYGEIARKNGKSIIGSVIGNYMFSADGEAGAEVYSGATTLNQAMEVFRPAWLQTKKSPGYKSFFEISLGGTDENPGNIYSRKSASRFEAVVGQPGDGASVHCGLVDEYHEHKTDALYNCFDTGMGSRGQPMLAIITTAGTNISYPCFAKRTQIIDILAGYKINDRVFGIIYTIDKEDDWQDFENWKKANPNMGVSVFEEFLRGQHTKALQNARKQNIIKCKHLNVWSNAGESFINMVEWEKAANPEMNILDFMDLVAFIGLDLASKLDIASVMILFNVNGNYHLFSRHYVPEETTKEEENEHYLEWVSDGYLIATPGFRIDLHQIQEDVKQFAKDFNLNGMENDGGEVCSDPWNAQQLITNLINEHIECVEIPQTTQHLSEPMKEVEAALREGTFHHDNNPVTKWMFGNVMVKEDHNGNIFPRKNSKKSKIDGAAATFNAMNRAMLGGLVNDDSVYESRGALFF